MADRTEGNSRAGRHHDVYSKLVHGNELGELWALGADLLHARVSEGVGTREPAPSGFQGSRVRCLDRNVPGSWVRRFDRITDPGGELPFAGKIVLIRPALQ